MSQDIVRPQVQVFKICQANTHAFRDLYIYNTMLVLVLSGSKRVVQNIENGVTVKPGELLIFPSGSFITIENRIISGGDYQAFCISYPDELVYQVFESKSSHTEKNKAVHINELPAGLATLIEDLPSTLSCSSLPPDLITHKSVEPLIWLKSMGVILDIPSSKSIDCKIRNLIMLDPAKKWRINDIAHAFGYSEATLRRKLADCNTTFSDIVINVRMEYGLTLLQTTDKPISQIALDSGFATPSHFSDVFRQRFNIQPKHIRQTAI